MQDDFNAPIKYSAAHRGYYYTSKVYRLPAIFLQKEEYEMFLLATQSLKALPLEKVKNNFLEDILIPIDNPINNPIGDTAQDKDKTCEKALKKIVFLQDDFFAISQISSVIINNFSALYKAISGENEVTFEYKKFSAAMYEWRNVRPYQLLFDTYNKKGWCLWCYDIDKSDMRLFLLSRMQNVKISEVRFKRNKDFEFEKSGSAFFGAFSSKEKWHFSIVFYGDAIEKVKDSTWGRDQKITKTNDGGMRLEFIGCEYYAILHWVLSFGSDVKIEEPLSLLQDWVDTVAAMANVAANLKK